MYIRCSNIKSPDYIGKQVTMKGWVYRLRKQKENTFILIRDDRGGIIQTVVPTEIAANLTIESSIEVTGELRQDSRAPEGGYEIRAKELKIIGLAQVDYPVGEYQSPELLLDKRHLALRTRRMISVAKIRAFILKFARQWFMDNDWIEVTAPTIVKGAVEGGSTLFRIKYFDEEAFLSQSAQLYLESMIFCLGPVWSLTTSFRAEKSRTVRHLAEFSHLEAEAPWVNLEDILSVQEQLISFIVQNAARHAEEDLTFLKININDLRSIEPPFDRLSYAKAIENLRAKDFVIVDEKGNERTIEYGDDLNIDSERELTKNSQRPVFIVGYPLDVKPFYVKEDLENKGMGLAADLLATWGFGEITSGGIREDDINSLTKRIRRENLDTNSYEWYLDLRRYGSVPHGGFGLGIERLVRWITNLKDIKDTVLFPRTMSRVTP